MDVASSLIHRAFTAHKAGDLAACDAFITEGQQACGGVFQMNAEYVVRWPNHTDDPAWMAFLGRLGTMIEPFAPEVPAPPRDDRYPDRVKVTRVDGAAFADCLFLIGQAWLKRVSGDERGALADLTAAAALVPDGTVEMLMEMIEGGALPEPRPEAMAAWLEHCRQADAGDLKLTVDERRALPRASVPPSRRVESHAEFLERFGPDPRGRRGPAWARPGPVSLAGKPRTMRGPPTLTSAAALAAAGPSARRCCSFWPVMTATPRRSA